MTDSEKVTALTTILTKYDEMINRDDGGERPFNEPGEVIEALWFLDAGNKERLVKVGWLNKTED